jgi:hypothetical protein
MNGTFTTGKLKSSLCRNLSLNNSKFGDFVDSIYPIELEIRNTTDTDWSASYLDLRIEIYIEGLFRTKGCDKEMISIFPS